ncbi:MAG: helix-turn-helix domain-containing protein [Bacteroidota bacterium]
MVSVNTEELKTDIGRRVRKIRGEMSQKEFAEALGTAPTYISDIERGRTKPSLELLTSIIGKYGVSIDWIITGKEQSPPPTIPVRPCEDPDLEAMMEALRGFWREGDEDKRAWLRLQFWAALPLVADWYAKKRHADEDAATGA